MELIDRPQNPEPERVSLTREQIEQLTELGNFHALRDALKTNPDE